MKRQIRLTISERLHRHLADNFDNPERGLSFEVEAFPMLFEKTLDELKGVFSENELHMIIDVFNGRLLKEGSAGECICGECTAEIDADALDKRWFVDSEAFFKKLESITAFQAACLEIWASAFWFGGGAVAAAARADVELTHHVRRLL